MSKPSISASDAAGASSLQLDHFALPSNGQRLVEALLREGKVEPLVNALRRLESEELRALLTRLRDVLVDAAFPAVDRPDAEAAGVSLSAQPESTLGDPNTEAPVDSSPTDAQPAPSIAIKAVDSSPTDARPVPSIVVEAVDPSPAGARPAPSIAVKVGDSSPTGAQPVPSIAVEAVDPSPTDARPAPSIALKEAHLSPTDARPVPSIAVESVDPSPAGARPVPPIVVKETTPTKLKSPKSRRGRAFLAFNFVIAIALATLLVTSVGVPSLNPRNEKFDVLEAVAKTAPSAEDLAEPSSKTEETQLPKMVTEKDGISGAAIASSPLPLTAVAPGFEKVEQKGTPPEVATNTVEPKAPASEPLAVSSYPPNEVELLINRGDQLFRTGDIVAARFFYRRAAAEGSIVAAARAAETFDPLFLAMIGAKGIRPDPRQALSWYRKASEAGDPEAARRVVSLLAEYPK